MSPSISSLSGPRFGGEVIVFPAPEDRAQRLAYLRLATGLRQALAGSQWREFAEGVACKLLTLVEEPCDDAGRLALQEKSRLLALLCGANTNPPQIEIADCKALVHLCMGRRNVLQVSSPEQLLFPERQVASTIWRR